MNASTPTVDDFPDVVLGRLATRAQVVEAELVLTQHSVHVKVGLLEHCCQRFSVSKHKEPNNIYYMKNFDGRTG